MEAQGDKNPKSTGTIQNPRGPIAQMMGLAILLVLGVNTVSADAQPPEFTTPVVSWVKKNTGIDLTSFADSYFKCSGTVVLITGPNTLHLDCKNVAAAQFLQEAQKYFGVPYSLSQDISRTKGISCSGLIVASLQDMAKKGKTLKKMKTMESLVESGAPVRHKVGSGYLTEQHPCSFLKESVAKTITKGYQVPNLADTQFGCFWLSGAGIRLDRLQDLQMGDLVFFDSTYHGCDANNEQPGAYWTTKQQKTQCFRGTALDSTGRAYGITHVGIVLKYDSQKGMLYTFEETSKSRLNPGTCQAFSGAGPRVWCDHRKRSVKDQRQCAGDLGLFDGGIRLIWN